MSEFIQKLFTSYKERTDGDTRVGELYRIWYDSNTNTLRVQLDNTPGGTIIGGGGSGGSDYTLPTASTTVKGGVKIDGTTIRINNQVISGFSGSYTDLSNRPALFSGSYTDLTNKPTIPAAQVNSDWNASSGLAQILNKPALFSGSYTDLSNKPTLFDGAYASLTGKPTLFSGSYNDLTDKPTIPSAYTLPTATDTILGGVKIGSNITINAGVISVAAPFSGSYTDLTNKPTIPAAQVNSDWNASSGLAQILNKPVLFSGSYNDLTNKPTIPAAQIQSDWTQSNNASLDFIKNKPTIPDIGPIQEVFSATTEPMGHADKSQSTISFDDSTRTFTISPVSTSYNVWVKGVKFVISTTRTVTIPNTSGLYYIYFDAAGALQYQTSYFDWPNQAPTAYVYWNSGTGKAPMVADERHGIVLDWQTHEYLHRTRGAAIANGFGATNYILGGNGSLNTHIQLDIASGTFFDEDLQVDVVSTNTPTANTWEQDLTGPSQIPIFYLSGTTGWVRDNPTTFPLKRGSVRPVYNLNTAGTWSTPDIDNNKFGATFIIATNNINYPVMGVISQTQHANQSDAEAINWSDLNLTGFPIVEFRPLYKVVYQTKTSYSNTPKATIVSLWDLRSFDSVISSAASFVDANALSGTVLAPSVVTSSLTSVGTLTGLTVTNTITGSVSGSAATLTTARNINGVGFNGSAAINIPTLTDGTNSIKITAVPSALTGTAGDVVGNIAFDGTSIYYCTTAYVSNSYTGTFLNSESASNYSQLRISNNWNPTLAYTPAYGWTVTFNPGGGNITRTVSSVSSWSNSYPNGYWDLILTSSWTGTVTLGDSFTLNPGTALPNIWKKVPWIVSGLTTTGTGAVSSLTAESFDTDQIRIVGNRIATSVTNANLALEPNGTGNITISTGTVVGTQTTQNIFNTTATTVNFAGAATTLAMGAATGTLTINNPTIVGTQTTQNIFNTTATTVNFAGAATTLAMGAATGTLTINNPTIATGSSGTLTLFNTGATTVTAFGAATTINLGYTKSVAFSNTFNIATNAQEFGTKTVNIGTGSSITGATYVNIGSTLGTSYVTVNGTLTATLTGNASTATKLATARAINGVNFDGSAAITVTAEAGTLSGSTLASGVTASSLTSVGTLTGVTSNAATAFSAGDSAISNVALSVPRDAAIRDRTNGASVIYFDVSNGGSTNGEFQFRSSSAFTNVLTMNTGAFNVNTNAVVTARTPSLARTAFNAAMGTELSVDDFRFRVTNSGLVGIFPQIISNASYSKNCAWTVVAARSGSAVTQTGSTGTIVANNAWTSLYTSGGMDSAGDTFTATLQDKAMGRIYRVTFMRSDNGTDIGYNIIAERLL